MGQRSGFEHAGRCGAGHRYGVAPLVRPGRLAALRRSPVARGAVVAAAFCLCLGGCEATGPVGKVRDFVFGDDSATPQAVSGFIGGVAADEPQAALAARAVLAQGGTAADAAVALAFTLAVTLPSRASLGAGGACLAYQPRAAGAGGGVPQAIMFTPIAPGSPGADADRPAAVPMLTRGMFLLHALYGSRPFESLLAPAEQLARSGAPVSRALARDLAQVSGPLFADPNARAVFATPGGGTPAEGAVLVQPALAETLAQVRRAGVGDLYQGVLAARLAEGAAMAGGGLTTADLRNAVPHAVAPLTLAAGADQVAFVPEPADGGVAAAAAFEVLQRSPADLAGAQSRSVVAAAAVRAGGDARAILAGAGGGPGLPALPASTSFVVLDRSGGAVACALTMDNLFGTGRMAAGTGVVLAMSPALARPMLAAALEWSPTQHAFRAAVAGSGQEGAALAVAAALNDARRPGQAITVPDPGRANVAECARYLPGAEQSCRFATDPRGAGLALGSE